MTSMQSEALGSEWRTTTSLDHGLARARDHRRQRVHYLRSGGEPRELRRGGVRCAETGNAAPVQTSRYCTLQVQGDVITCQFHAMVSADGKSWASKGPVYSVQCGRYAYASVRTDLLKDKGGSAHTPRLVRSPSLVPFRVKLV